MLLFASTDVKGLVGGNRPVFVHLVGELGLGVDVSTEFEHVVHGGLVGKAVLATGCDVSGLLKESLSSTFRGVGVELVSVNELLFDVVLHAASVNLSVHVGTNEVLIAIFSLSHEQNFGT